MPGLLASEDELDRITESFAQLPLRNPNGTTGINITWRKRDAKIPTLSLVFLPLSSLIVKILSQNPHFLFLKSSFKKIGYLPEVDSLFFMRCLGAYAFNLSNFALTFALNSSSLALRSALRSAFICARAWL